MLKGGADRADRGHGQWGRQGPGQAEGGRCSSIKWWVLDNDSHNLTPDYPIAWLFGGGG